MDIASTMYTGSELRKINDCRISLQVTYLSDIAAVDGRCILLAYYNGKGHKDAGHNTRLNWPPIGNLPQSHWKLWQSFLERWCGTSLKIERPLGGWFERAEILTCLCFFAGQMANMRRKLTSYNNIVLQKIYFAVSIGTRSP